MAVRRAGSASNVRNALVSATGSRGGTSQPVARSTTGATAKGTITGVGTGATVVDIVPQVAWSLPGVRIDNVELRLASIP